jgi:tRNA/rRNA methyltransferase
VEDRLGAVTVVLCRPRNPQNLGAAARALRCAGISRWAIVDPRTHDFESARRVAVHAEELLDKPRLCGNLREAIEGCSLTVGTTARQRPGRPLLSPQEASARLVRARGQVAVVFGDERSGMTAEEVDAVDLLSTIPSDPAQPSWNLAQAIAIYAFELRSAALHQRFATPSAMGKSATVDVATGSAGMDDAAESSREARRTEASPDALSAVDRALAGAVDALGKPGLRRRLFRALDRAALSPREATLWTAFFRAVSAQPKREAPRR